VSNLAQITQQAARDGIPAPTVERDYVLAHIIAALGTIGDGHCLVFKGGTALRLCYFEEYRYSADLDFSVVKDEIDGAYAIIETALTRVTGAIEGLNLTGDSPKRIAYRGPLGRLRFLKLDITDDELVLNVNTIRLLPRWPDLPESIGVPVYPLVEIAGEKLRCIIQRMQCRDLYDLWYLFGDAGVNPHDAVEIFRQKATHRNLNPNEFKTRYRSRLKQYQRRWIHELENHLPKEVPHFEHVERTVTRHLRFIGL